ESDMVHRGISKGIVAADGMRPAELVAFPTVAGAIGIVVNRRKAGVANNVRVPAIRPTAVIVPVPRDIIVWVEPFLPEHDGFRRAVGNRPQGNRLRKPHDDALIGVRRIAYLGTTAVPNIAVPELVP